MLCIFLRKGTAAAHYIMAGPQANNNNAFTIGTATTEYTSCTVRRRRLRPLREGS